MGTRKRGRGGSGEGRDEASGMRWGRVHVSTGQVPLRQKPQVENNLRYAPGWAQYSSSYCPSQRAG